MPTPTNVMLNINVWCCQLLLTSTRGAKKKYTFKRTMYLTLFKVLSLVGSVFIYIQWVVPINGPVLGWMGGWGVQHMILSALSMIC